MQAKANREVSVSSRRAGDVPGIRDVIILRSTSSTVPDVSFSLLTEIVLVLHHKVVHIGRDKMLKLLSEEVCHLDIRKAVKDAHSDD